MNQIFQGRFGTAFCVISFLCLVTAQAQEKPAAARNLIAPQNGGTVVWFTSRDPKSELAQLTDGKVDTAGWRSKDEYLPQDFVFAFEKDDIKAVEAVVINPKNPNPKATWASNFVVSASLESPLSGFQEVGEFSLKPEGTNQQFVINRAARFIKIRIIANGGGAFTSLGEIQVLEGPKELLKDVQPAKSAYEVSERDLKPAVDSAATAETEPNNTSAEARALEPGAVIKGTIDPPGEEDRFKVRVPGSASNVITFELTGRPNIRTSLNLLGADETPLKHFDPAKVMAESVNFSWAVAPGDYTVQMTEPPVSMVLIWDTSESMRESIGNLQKAVEAYLDDVRPGDRLKLMRFSKDVEVITPEFLSDSQKLKEAAKGKFATRSGTSLFDAVSKGLQLLDGIVGNRAIVLMTDGSDSSSQLDHPGFWKMLQEKRVRLYNIGLGGGMKRYSTTTGTICERVLTHAALASNGRYFTATNSDELKGFYQKISKELRSTSTYYLSARVSQGAGRLNVIATGEPIVSVSSVPQVEIILDASGSMKDFAGSKRKIEIARQVLSQVVQQMPADTRLALRLYGHRLRPGEPGDCEDTELVFPFGKVDKARIAQTIQKVTAIGNTLIAYSLRQVAKDFEGIPGEKVIILATDGKEDCGGQPLEAVDELISKGLKFRLDIIGLALNDKKATEQMQRLAARTGGKFYEAKDAKTLAQAFQSSLAVQYDVLDADGAKVAGGLTGQGDISVPEGIFSVTIHGDQPITVPNIRISANRLTRVALKKQGQQIAIDAQAP